MKAWLALTAAAVLLGAAAPPPGASGCSGCHAPAAAATGIPAIAGMQADTIVAALDGFRAGTRPATVMDRIAKGFTPEEVRVIAAWWAAQR